MSILLNESIFNETFIQIDSTTYITDSPYKIRNILLNKPTFYRILYDKDKDIYIISSSLFDVHLGLFEILYEQGYYPEIENSYIYFRNAIARDKINNTTGELVNIRKLFCLEYYYDEEISLAEIGDNYTHKYDCFNGYLVTRDFELSELPELNRVLDYPQRVE